VETRDTRDIVIQTQQRLSSLESKIDDFIEDSRESRQKMMEKLAQHEALVNKGKGAWTTLIGAGAISGWLGSHLPKLLGGGS